MRATTGIGYSETRRFGEPERFAPQTATHQEIRAADQVGVKIQPRQRMQANNFAMGVGRPVILHPRAGLLAAGARGKAFWVWNNEKNRRTYHDGSNVLSVDGNGCLVM